MGKSAVLEQPRPTAMREGRDIEWLVNWALEKHHLAPAIGREVAGRSRDIPTGMRVDGGGYRNDGKWVHDDAHVVADALGKMLGNSRVAEAAALVQQHGRMGTQPDWGMCRNGRYVLERRNGGEGKAIKRFRDQRQGRGLLGFEWKWVGHSVETLELMMLQYAAWHAGLTELREMVNPAMRQYVATGPSAKAEPWDDPVFIKATAVPDEIDAVG